jgi:hypothetical protein
MSARVTQFRGNRSSRAEESLLIYSRSILLTFTKQELWGTRSWKEMGGSNCRAMSRRGMDSAAII